MYVCVWWSTSTCVSTTVQTKNSEPKNLTGFFKKNSHPLETAEILCLPPQPPTSMLWSEVPSIINRNGCFFWRPPSTKFRRQHWIGGRGGHNLYGVVLHGVAVFFEEPGILMNQKNTVSYIYILWYFEFWDIPKCYPIISYNILYIYFGIMNMIFPKLWNINIYHVFFAWLM